MALFSLSLVAGILGLLGMKLHLDQKAKLKPVPVKAKR
jgi:hypothetical protein